jgi:hypothetical protein
MKLMLTVVYPPDSAALRRPDSGRAAVRAWLADRPRFRIDSTGFYLGSARYVQPGAFWYTLRLLRP